MFDPILLALIGAALTWCMMLKNRLNRMEARLAALEKNRNGIVR